MHEELPPTEEGEERGKKEVSLLSSAADLSSSGGGVKEDLGNPFHIEPSDREIQKAFQTALISLLKAKKELSTETALRIESQPFHLFESKSDAFEVIKNTVQLEVCVLRLIMSVTRSPSNPNSKKALQIKEYSVEDLRDMLGLLNYINHIRRNHNQHLDQLTQLTTQLLNTSEARYEIAQQALVEQIKCEKHPERQAVGKNLQTNKPQCAECISGGQ